MFLCGFFLGKTCKEDVINFSILFVFRSWKPWMCSAQELLVGVYFINRTSWQILMLIYSAISAM